MAVFYPVTAVVILPGSGFSFLSISLEDCKNTIHRQFCP